MRVFHIPKACFYLYSEIVKNPFECKLLGEIKRYSPLILAAALLMGSNTLYAFDSTKIEKPLIATPIYSGWIEYDSEKGKELLRESLKFSADYFPLSQHRARQNQPWSCGPETAAWIFNALGIPRPTHFKGSNKKNFLYWTYESVLGQTQKAPGVPAVGILMKKGMSLEQWAAMMSAFTVAKAFHAGETPLTRFRESVIRNLATPGNFLVVNYDRKALKQEGGGHISPIAAYHTESDYVLIFDVNPSLYNPVWVNLEDLYQAMNTFDSDAKVLKGDGTPLLDPRGNPVYKKRGWVEIELKTSQPAN